MILKRSTDTSILGNAAGQQSKTNWWDSTVAWD